MISFKKVLSYVRSEIHLVRRNSIFTGKSVQPFKKIIFRLLDKPFNLKIYVFLIFRAQLSILDGVFVKHSQRFKAINYFRKKLYLRCVTGSWMRLCKWPVSLCKADGLANTLFPLCCSNMSKKVYLHNVIKVPAQIFMIAIKHYQNYWKVVNIEEVHDLWF